MDVVSPDSHRMAGGIIVAVVGLPLPVLWTHHLTGAGERGGVLEPVEA